MKILGISGSPRKEGNTDILIKRALAGAKAQGAVTQFISLSDYDIADCNGCEGCAKSTQCIIKDDMQRIYPLLDDADALVIGSPTYFYNVTGLMKVFLDRLYCWLIFDKDDRSIWSYKNADKNKKPAIVIAVCEQETAENLGFTDLAISKTIECIGYYTQERIRIFRAFAKGAINNAPSALANAYRCGQALADSLAEEIE